VPTLKAGPALKRDPPTALAVTARSQGPVTVLSPSTLELVATK